MHKLIILLTGMPGSGKSIVAEVAKSMNIEVLSMGDIVREEVSRRKLQPTPENILKVATELRKIYGLDIIARRTTKKLIKIQSNVVLIDGVRGLYEVKVFKQYGECIVLAIHSSPKTRYERLRKRNRPGDPKTWNEFINRDLTELEFGIGNVIALADYIIVNEGSIEEFKRSVTTLLQEVLRKYESKSRSRDKTNRE